MVCSFRLLVAVGSPFGDRTGPAVPAVLLAAVPVRLPGQPPVDGLPVLVQPPAVVPVAVVGVDDQALAAVLGGQEHPVYLQALCRVVPPLHRAPGQAHVRARQVLHPVDALPVDLVEVHKLKLALAAAVPFDRPDDGVDADVPRDVKDDLVAAHRAVSHPAHDVTDQLAQFRHWFLRELDIAPHVHWNVLGCQPEKRCSGIEPDGGDVHVPYGLCVCTVPLPNTVRPPVRRSFHCYLTTVSTPSHRTDGADPPAHERRGCVPPPAARTQEYGRVPAQEPVHRVVQVLVVCPPLVEVRLVPAEVDVGGLLCVRLRDDLDGVHTAAPLVSLVHRPPVLERVGRYAALDLDGGGGRERVHTSPGGSGANGAGMGSTVTGATDGGAGGVILPTTTPNGRLRLFRRRGGSPRVLPPSSLTSNSVASRERARTHSTPLGSVNTSYLWKPERVVSHRTFHFPCSTCSCCSAVSWLISLRQFTARSPARRCTRCKSPGPRSPAGCAP